MGKKEQVVGVVTALSFFGIWIASGMLIKDPLVLGIATLISILGMIPSIVVAVTGINPMEIFSN